MNDFKVKLISFPSTYYRNTCGFFKAFAFPYGPGVLTAFLRDHNYGVNLDDLSVKIENYNRRPCFSLNHRISLDIFQYEKEIIDYVCGRCRNRRIEHFVEQIAQIADCQGYGLIGMSVMTYFHFLFAILLAKKIKSLNNNARIVLGGPFITIYGKELFEQFPVADYIIIGDGQVPLLKLVEHLEGGIPIEDVPSLFYRQNGSIRATPKKLFPIEDVYLPDFSDLSLNLYRSVIVNKSKKLVLPYQITRGCIHNCSFCNRRAISPFFESKSYNKIITELRAMKGSYQSDYFSFCDQTINCSYEYLDKLCDIFIEENLGISWRAFARADNLDRKILHKMRKAGCKVLSFGVESGSNRILKMMGKNFTIEQASRVLRDSYEEGIENGLFLMVGFPHEREEDITETIKSIRNNSEYIDTIATISPFRVEYATPLYNNPGKFGIENLRPVFNDSYRSEFKYFAFDEVGGLKWKEKVRQQEDYRKRVFKANFKYIFSKKYHLSFIPFWLYFLLTERLRLLYRDSFSRLLEILSSYLHRKNV